MTNTAETGATGLLPEDADERRMFDDTAKTLGSPLLSIAGSLYVQRGIMSIPGASFYEQSTIQYNEIIKADRELAQLRAVNRDARFADVVGALEELLALPMAARELRMLDVGIGTKTPLAAWLRARNILSSIKAST